MIITPKEISIDTGFHPRWISSRFSHIAEDYLHYAHAQYDVDKMIAVCEQYKSNTRNPKQKRISEEMMAFMLGYLTNKKRTANDTRTSRA